MNAVFLDRSSLDFADLDLSPLEAVVDQLECHDRTLAGQVAERIADAQVVIVNKVVLDRAVLSGASALRLVCVAATGTNNVDLAAAAELGIRVCNCQAYGTASVVQHVFALLLGLATRLPDYQQAVARGDWQRSEQFCLLDYPITELAGKVMGIVGYGELGQGVARIAEAFGMQVRVAQRPGSSATAGREPLEQLLAEVDVLSLHCPLTEATRNLIGAAELARMKPSALLINAARGGIVDEQALADALRAGRIAGAGVDVLSQEPPSAGNPLLAADIPNLILTPHSAWGSLEARQRIVQQLAATIAAWTRGQPCRVVA